MFYGREVSEGIWIARNVSLHPSATLVAPVYLGENCRIGSGIRLGPNVVVVRDCVLDSGSTAADSTVLPGSYVGQALELDHVIVDRNRLVNVRAGGETIVRDDFILSAISSTNFRSAFTTVLSRAAALAVIAFTWPLLLVTMLVLRLFRKGPVLHRMEALRLPADESSWAWKTFRLNSLAAPGSSTSAWSHFFLRFLPGLLNVARGDLHMVGVAPRNSEDVMALPVDWRVLYLRARAGLVTEAFVLHGADASADEVYSCEAFYSVAAGLRHDAAILLRFLGRMFQPHPSERGSCVGGANLHMK